MRSDPAAAQQFTSHAVIVLGMHRSGTSVLSRALIALGVDFGGAFVDIEDDNPKGFFEDKDVNSLNVSFLRSADCHWYRLVLPETYTPESEEHFKNQASALIKKKFAASPLWGLKDPRITRLSGLWEAIISGLNASGYYILANRNPLSVADSLAKRDDIPRAHSLALWLLHQIDGLQTVTRHHGLIIDYDLMMNQPSTELDRLALFLEKDVDEQSKKIFEDEFLDRDLRHTYHTDTPRTGSPLTEACLSFHHKLVELAQSQGPMQGTELEAAKEALDEARKIIAEQSDWLCAIDAVYRKLERTTHELHESKRNLQHVRSKLTWVEERLITKLARKFKRLF